MQFTNWEKLLHRITEFSMTCILQTMDNTTMMERRQKKQIYNDLNRKEDTWGGKDNVECSLHFQRTGVKFTLGVPQQAAFSPLGD